MVGILAGATATAADGACCAGVMGLRAAVMDGVHDSAPYAEVGGIGLAGDKDPIP
jgi:hypothetical protein